MIPKRAEKGARTAGLLYYLWGPGRANEHTDPHMVAAWDPGVVVRCEPSRGGDIPVLARLLDVPVAALESRRPTAHVYHVAVRLAPEDRALSDAEWADVAREILDAAGVAPVDDAAGCRWIAMRHADDHIHIVATLARQDGRTPSIRRDWPKMQARARELERRLGLVQLGSGDRTAAPWPQYAELEKAKRRGRPEPARFTLRTAVREAAAGATDEHDFFTRLERAGLRVQQRVAPDGAVTGYSVALPGDRTAASRAVWFSGSRLAPDLSLPRIRERWTGAAPAGNVATWEQAAEHVHQAAAALALDDTTAAGDLAVLGDTITAYAPHAPRMVREEVAAAARSFERAGRAPGGRALDGEARQLLRQAGRFLDGAARGSGLAAAVLMLAALLAAVLAAQRHHEARGLHAHARAAGAAAGHLRAATELMRGAATGRGRRAVVRSGAARATGRRSAAGEGVETVVRAALPELAGQVLSDAAWPALRTAVEAAERAGYEPVQLLAQVAARRELGSAASVAQVLAWRVQGRMRADAERGVPQPAQPRRGSTPTHPQPPTPRHPPRLPRR